LVRWQASVGGRGDDSKQNKSLVDNIAEYRSDGHLRGIAWERHGMFHGEPLLGPLEKGKACGPEHWALTDGVTKMISKVKQRPATRLITNLDNASWALWT
jgi:hypothetical protein